MDCPNCGEPLGGHEVFCGRCGARVPPAPRSVPGAAAGPAAGPPAGVAPGWRPVEAPAHWVNVTMSVTCDHCAQPVPVNGPTRSVHCQNCEGDTPLRRVPAELALAAEGAQLLGSPYKKRSFDSPEPQCRKCGASVPVGPYLEQTGGIAVVPCPRCGTGLPTYPAPAWMVDELPTARQVFGGDPEVARAEAGMALEVDQQAAAPITMSCPQCNGALKITAETPRTLACSYCSTQVFLPDALWTRMHPAKVMRRWTVSYTGELKTREDVEEEKEEREEAQREQAERLFERHQETVATKRKSGRAKIFAFVGVGVAVAAGIVLFFVVGKGCSKADGTFTATGEPIGDRTVNPVRCKSGQRMNFHGVMLLTEDDAVAIRIVEDPVKGTLIGVLKPETCKGDQCEYVVFDREECDVFDVSIESTNTTVNDIRVLEGHLKLDCKFADTGGTAQASITFSCD